MIGRAFAGRIVRQAVIAGGAVAVATVWACGGSELLPRPPEREAISEQRIARFAYNRGQYEQAVVLYDRALATAYTRDDIEAIAEIGYESALALHQDGRSKQAADQARRIREELVRRGKVPPTELLLVEAVASYASGDADSANRIAEEIVAQGGGTGSVITARAVYLQGMIAADGKDAAGVAGTIETLGTPLSSELRADRLELLGRLQLIEGAPQDAILSFTATAELRQEVEDYTGMARALAFAGEAMIAAERPADAADFFLRAGRGVAHRKDKTDAERWLRKAAALAERHDRPDISEAASEQLSRLSE
jgi:tetratricopeptide (TPR) repeat protein